MINPKEQATKRARKQRTSTKCQKSRATARIDGRSTQERSGGYEIRRERDDRAHRRKVDKVAQRHTYGRESERTARIDERSSKNRSDTHVRRSAKRYMGGGQLAHKENERLEADEAVARKHRGGSRSAVFLHPSASMK